jgi:hypothetical protein
LCNRDKTSFVDIHQPLSPGIAYGHSREEKVVDHQAFAQLLGNYGEFVGAIAVVVTLGYLAFQVRQTRLVTTADMKQRLSEELVQINRDAYTNPEFAEFLSKLPDLGSLEELEPATRIRIEQYGYVLISRAKHVFDLHEAGFVDSHTLQASGISRLRNSIKKHKVIAEHWENVKALFSPEFQQRVDSEIEFR